jgi:hypothetical protein
MEEFFDLVTGLIVNRISMDGIKPQMVMIIEIFVAQHQAMNPLTDKFLNAVFDITLVAVIDETAGKISQQRNQRMCFTTLPREGSMKVVAF